jgi:hypothetical protein
MDWKHHTSSHDLEGLRKIMKYTGQDSQSLDQNSNLGLLSYK